MVIRLFCAAGMSTSLLVKKDGRGRQKEKREKDADIASISIYRYGTHD